MIYVDRSNVPRPAILDSTEVQTAQKSAEEFFSIPQSKRGQRRFTFDLTLLAHPELRDALSRLFRNKCSFCESIMTWSIMENVNRYRPIAQSIELDGTIFPDHYWWLVFDWDNAIPLCTECLRACGTRFPILGARASVGVHGDELLQEQPLLLNPCYDRPEEHLVFTVDGQVVSSTRPGQVTIEIFNMNRPGLVENRRKVYLQYQEIKIELIERITRGARQDDPKVDNYLQTLRHAGDADQPFAGMMRQFLHTWISALGEFTEFTAQLNEAREKKDRVAQAQALLGLGKSAIELQDYQNAKDAFEAALQLADDQNDVMTAMLAHIGLGEVFAQQKVYSEAIHHLEKSMQMASETGSVNNEALAAANLAAVYVGAGNLEEAKKTYRRVLNLSDTLGEKSTELAALSGLGNACLAQGEYSGAIEWYELTLKLARDLGFVQAEQAAMNGLGNAHAARGDAEQARKYYTQPKDRQPGIPDALRSLYQPFASRETLSPDDKAARAEERLYEQNAAQQFVTWKTNLEKVDLTTLDPSSDIQKESYFTATRMVDWVEIKNFKVIEHLVLDITRAETSGGPWMMLLGENGSGKSSLIQAVTLALVGETYRNELPITPQEVLRYGKDEGYVRVYLSGSDQPVEMTFDRDSTHFKSNPAEPRTLVLAYGATRLLPKGDAKPLPGKPYAHVDNMFNPFVPLRDATAWMLDMDDEQFDKVARVLKALLALDEDDALCRHRGKKAGVYICRGGIEDPLSYMSDGYQSVLALSADVLAIMLDLWKAPEIAEGLVVIDELGAHLHPRWRMRIVKSLRAAFPRLQFLISTHDPLCLRGLNEGEVTVMRLRADRTAEAVIDLPPVQGLRVDQLLTSQHFGMFSTIDPDVEALFQEYYNLLAARSLSEAQQNRLNALKTELQKFNLMGNNRRERMMLEIIDDYLAEEPLIDSPVERSEREKEARSKAKAILTSIK